MPEKFDVIVVGGGHAGAEAAWAACRLGAKTALVTMQRQAIGRLSCNPAIGGLAKGQIVREIDALGGLMGLAIDRAGIQFRILNKKKGPAVRAPRAQADADAYPAALQELLGRASGLTIIEGSVENVELDPRRLDQKQVSGVLLKDGTRLRASTVVLTTGTFLRGLMHCGEQQDKGGRIGEPGAEGLSDVLRSLGFELGRLKTGTPPRVHRDSVDYAACQPQPGDEYPTPFSFMTDVITQPQIHCWITHTNQAAHDHIRGNLHRAPMYSGQIKSKGPRYCPSIEDKVVRFAEKPRHQIFLEPEGRNRDRVYCNGISTSLPRDVQEAFVHCIAGLEQARIVQYGYAVEYDWVPTHQTRISLESKLVNGLFLAGQINGTSGYEEAAAQGLVAGVNAVRSLGAMEPWVLGRDEAYIGVMIDDLITRPPNEPYRMFTSRAEYRLKLRSDNADVRLTPIGHDLGTVDESRWRRFSAKLEARRVIESLCEHRRVDGVSLADWLRRPEADVARMAERLGAVDGQPFCVDDLAAVLTSCRYRGYLQRQEEEVERFRRLESMAIPAGLNYAAIPQLKSEAREALSRISPSTVGQAARISGINPADITVLWVHITGRLSSRKVG